MWSRWIRIRNTVKSLVFETVSTNLVLIVISDFCSYKSLLIILYFAESPPSTSSTEAAQKTKESINSYGSMELDANITNEISGYQTDHSDVDLWPSCLLDSPPPDATSDQSALPTSPIRESFSSPAPPDSPCTASLLDSPEPELRPATPDVQTLGSEAQQGFLFSESRVDRLKTLDNILELGIRGSPASSPLGSCSSLCQRVPSSSPERHVVELRGPDLEMQLVSPEPCVESLDPKTQESVSKLVSPEPCVEPRAPKTQESVSKLVSPESHLECGVEDPAQAGSVCSLNPLFLSSHDVKSTDQVQADVKLAVEDLATSQSATKRQKRPKSGTPGKFVCENCSLNFKLERELKTHDCFFLVSDGKRKAASPPRSREEPRDEQPPEKKKKTTFQCPFKKCTKYKVRSSFAEYLWYRVLIK
jgi:hypothetical protein